MFAKIPRSQGCLCVMNTVPSYQRPLITMLTILIQDPSLLKEPVPSLETIMTMPAMPLVINNAVSPALNLQFPACQPGYFAEEQPIAPISQPLLHILTLNFMYQLIPSTCLPAPALQPMAARQVQAATRLEPAVRPHPSPALNPVHSLRLENPRESSSNRSHW